MWHYLPSNFLPEYTVIPEQWYPMPFILFLMYFATLIAFIGVRLSKKSADDDHPYGHERFECVASLLLGTVLLLTGLAIGKSGLGNILSGDYTSLAVPGAVALVAAVVSIALLKKPCSGIQDTTLNFLTHLLLWLMHGTIGQMLFLHRFLCIGIGGSMLGFHVLDPLASVIICVCILKVAVDIIKDSVRKMLDTSCGENYDNTLKNYIAAQDGVKSVDSLHSRMFGNKVYIDLEISVDRDLPLHEAHDIADRVHDNVEKNFSNIKHIMIHVNPTA